MNFMSCRCFSRYVRIVMLLLLAGSVSVSADDPASERPTAVVYLTQDANLPPQIGRKALGILKQAIESRTQWLVVGRNSEVEMGSARRLMKRSELLAEGRRYSADLAIAVHLYERQGNYRSIFSYATALGVSMDSSAIYSAPLVYWATTDTVIMRRQLEGLVDRLNPRSSGNCCFAEIRSIPDTTANTGEYRRVLIRVRDTERRGVPGADIHAHWVVDARRIVSTVVRSDHLGMARFDFDALPGESAVSLTDFLIDSVVCAELPYDPQWLLRDVDNAVAMMENGRADLDEEQDYESAITRLEAFLALEPGDVELYELVISTHDARDRRERAQHLLRRATAESDRRMMTGEVKRSERVGWSSGFWFSLEPWVLRGSTIEAEPVDCDTCSNQDFKEYQGNCHGLSITVTRRTGDKLWLTGSMAVYLSELTTRSYRAVSVTRKTTTLSLCASAIFPARLQGDLYAVGELGLRLNRTTSNDDEVFYWVDGKKASDISTSSTTYRDPEIGDGYFRPGIYAGGGLMFRVSPLAPLWWKFETGVALDLVEQNRFKAGLMCRAGVAFWWN